jgi:hypothetical protein
MKLRCSFWQCVGLEAASGPQPIDAKFTPQYVNDEHRGIVPVEFSCGLPCRVSAVLDQGGVELWFGRAAGTAQNARRQLP